MRPQPEHGYGVAAHARSLEASARGRQAMHAAAELRFTARRLIRDTRAQVARSRELLTIWSLGHELSFPKRGRPSRADQGSPEEPVRLRIVR